MKLCLGKKNFIVMGIAALCILIGFIMMCGPASTMDTFNPDVFSTRRVVTGPNICVFGYLLMIVGILVKDKKRMQQTDETPTHEQEQQ